MLPFLFLLPKYSLKYGNVIEASNLIRVKNKSIRGGKAANIGDVVTPNTILGS